MGNPILQWWLFEKKWWVYEFLGATRIFFWGGGRWVHSPWLLFLLEDFEHCFSPKRRIKSSFPPGSLDILMGSVPKKSCALPLMAKVWVRDEISSCFMLVPCFFGPNNRFSDILRRFKGFSWKVWILASSRMLLSFCKITFLVYPIDP